MFSSREIAVAFWTSIFVTWAATKRPVRTSVWRAFKSILTPKILVPLLVLAGYVGSILGLLAAGRYAYPELLKDGVIWLLFTGLVVPFRFVTGDRQAGFLRPLLRDSIGVLILFEFLVATYTFHIAVELLIVPVFTLIALVGVAREMKPEYRSAARFSNWLQGILGLAVLMLALRRAAFDPSIREIGTVRQFLLPLILTTAIIPYVYLLLLYASYDDLYIRVGLHANASKGVRRYGALRVLMRTRLSPAAALRYLKQNAPQLLKVRSKADVEHVLAAQESTDGERRG